jgi:pimeloyl-ACP methyl ester carboxylesterase
MWTELEWAIRPLLEEWAEVASYDPAGADPGADAEASRQLFVERGLERIDELGWTEYFVVSDTFGTATAVRLASARPEAVRGMAIGHPALSWEDGGERAVIRSELWSAMFQLMRDDLGSFARHGITQLTQGSYDEELAERMIERIPVPMMYASWELVRDHDEPMGELLGVLDCPLLFAKHEGCLMFTDEGFEDATGAFPDARTLATVKAPCADDEFASALRSFCS